MELLASLGAFAVAVGAVLALARWRGEVLRELRTIRETIRAMAEGRGEPDAGCEPGLPHLEWIPDRHTVWLVLFAHVLYSGPEALEARAQEWRELFGGDR